MINTDYYKEMATYYMTDYEFLKRSCIRCEESKTIIVEMLEKAVNNLKELMPKDKPVKMGKVVRFRIAN